MHKCKCFAIDIANMQNYLRGDGYFFQIANKNYGIEMVLLFNNSKVRNENYQKYLA